MSLLWRTPNVVIVGVEDGNDDVNEQHGWFGKTAEAAAAVA